MDAFQKGAAVQQEDYDKRDIGVLLASFHLHFRAQDRFTGHGKTRGHGSGNVIRFSSTGNPDFPFGEGQRESSPRFLCVFKVIFYFLPWEISIKPPLGEYFLIFSQPPKKQI